MAATNKSPLSPINGTKDESSWHHRCLSFS